MRRDPLHEIIPGAWWGGTLGTWLDGAGDPVQFAADGYVAELRIGSTDGSDPILALTPGAGLTLKDDGTVDVDLVGSASWALRSRSSVAVDLDVTATGGEPVALMRSSAPIGDRVGVPAP